MLQEPSRFAIPMCWPPSVASAPASAARKAFAGAGAQYETTDPAKEHRGRHAVTYRLTDGAMTARWIYGLSIASLLAKAIMATPPLAFTIRMRRVFPRNQFAHTQRCRRTREHA